MRRVVCFALACSSLACPDSGPKAQLKGPAQVYDAPTDLDEQEIAAELLQRVQTLEGVGDVGCPVQLLARFEQRITMLEDEPTPELALKVGFRPLGGAHEGCRISAEVTGSEAAPLVPAALEAFGARWAARRAPDRKLLADLGADSEALQASATAEVGLRKLKSAVPVLVEQLGSESTSDDRALKIIEALVQIGDPRAAPALIAATDRASPLVWPPVLFGLSQLGGRQAEGFLFTVAQGHPNPDVRRRARLALDEIKRTEDSAKE